MPATCPIRPTCGLALMPNRHECTSSHPEGRLSSVSVVIAVLVVIALLLGCIAILSLLVLLQLRSMQADSRGRMQAVMDELDQAELELAFLRSVHRE